MIVRRLLWGVLYSDDSRNYISVNCHLLSAIKDAKKLKLKGYKHIFILPVKGIFVYDR